MSHLLHTFRRFNGHPYRAEYAVKTKSEAARLSTLLRTQGEKVRRVESDNEWYIYVRKW